MLLYSCVKVFKKQPLPSKNRLKYLKDIIGLNHLIGQIQSSRKLDKKLISNIDLYTCTIAIRQGGTSPIYANNVYNKQLHLYALIIYKNIHILQRPFLNCIIIIKG